MDTRKPLSISRKQARRLALIHQGLHSSAPFGKGKTGLLNAINQIGYVQIDTISVVERAHHHVIRTRVPNYRKEDLLDLQVNDRSILEFWSHAAAYIPMSDYRFTLPIVDYFKEGKDPWPMGERKVMKRVLERIKAEGPLMSRDFEKANNPTGAGWWEMKPAKMALQRLFFEGELLVSHRKGFQRIYDLTERIVPSNIETHRPNQDEYADFLIDRHLRAHAIGDAAMIGYLRRGMRKPIQARLKAQLEMGTIVRVDVKGIEKSELYARPDILNQLSTRISKQLKILSPFDNSVIQRGRLSDIFEYYYQIECYVPKPKRVHGYFVLPLLLGDTFVGRLDAKADRKTKVFHVISLYTEPNVDIEEFVSKLAPSLLVFAKYNGCKTIEIHQTYPEEIGTKLAYKSMPS